MFEKRFWSNLILFLTFVVCLTLWKLSTTSPAPPQVSPPPHQALYSLIPNTSASYTYPMDFLKPSDYNQLIDLYFNFNILNSVCNDTSPLLLILVHSSPHNQAKRRTIRETWGKVTQTNEVRLIFVTGATNGTKLQERLNQESDTYRDIAQGNFLDTYRNITYKHVMVLKYAIYHCPQAKYILKTDDDVFVNMPTLLPFLKNVLSSNGATNLLMCSVTSNLIVKRSYRSKWRVSFSEYPYKIYPVYCPGWVLIYSQDVVFKLYKEAQVSDFFWIDDIHITGTLAKKLHISHTDISNLVLTQKTVLDIVENSKNVSSPFLFGNPDLKEKQIRALWSFVHCRTHQSR